MRCVVESPGGSACRASTFAAASWLAALAIVCGACSEADRPRTSGPAEQEGGTRPMPMMDAGSAVDQDGSADRDAASTHGADAMRAPLMLGITPADEEQSDPAERTFAHLEVIAAGSRALSLLRRYDELYASPSEPRADAWEELERVASLYRNAGRSLLFSVALLDRTVDARPELGKGEWDDAESLAAAEALIDRVFDTFGAELVYFAIGNEVDHWLSKAAVRDRQRFVSLAGHMLDYARRHPRRLSTTRLGVSRTWTAFVDGALPELSELDAASDVTVVTYYPISADYLALAPGSASADLAAIAQAVPGDSADSRQVVIQEVGYPSAELAGGSLQAQKEFFDSFFQALEFRRASFPFVSVFELADRPTTACEQDAVAFGDPDAPKLISARCSLGIRSEMGVPKPAWASVLGALSAYSDP